VRRKKNNTRNPLKITPFFFLGGGGYYTCTCLKANTKPAGFKTFQTGTSEHMKKTQLRLAQSKAREGLEEDTSTLTGNETGLLATS